MSVPGQLYPPRRLFGVSIDRCRSDGLPESVELGFETFDLLPDVFEFL